MRTFLLVLSLLLLCLPQDAGAQPFDPRDDEAEFNAAAMKHAANGEYEAAIADAQKAVDIRGLNVFWLNLGRFQQRAGRCTDSMNSYTNAMTAPPVTEPNAALVKQTAQKYMAELVTQCPPQVTVQCTPADLAVVAKRSDDVRAPMPIACGQQVSLSGGEWVFTGTYGNEQTEATWQLRIARDYTIPLVIDVPVAGTKTVTTPNGTETELNAIAPPPKKSMVPKALMFAGAGVIAATGLALDLALPTSHNGTLDGVDFVPVGMYLVSIGLVVAGAMW